MLKNFFEKKIAGNLIFWICCGLSYGLITLIGALFFPDSKAVSKSNLLVDMTGKIDSKFIVIIFVAMVVSTVLGALVQLISVKTKGGIEIGLLAIESAYGQFISFGSICFSMAFLTLLYHFAAVENINLITIEFNFLMGTVSYWLVSLVVFIMVERFKENSAVNK